MEYCVCTWCLEAKELLRDFGCHIDLGRGHLFFEKLGVRDVVTSEQSPHLLLPLTSFGLQGHKIPAEIQPRISSDECAIYRAICDSSRQNKIHSWIASASDHRAPETDSTNTESLYGTDGQKKPCDEARDYWENREGRWVRVHGIARRTLFDPCTTKSDSWEQQSEVTIDDTWSRVGEMPKPLEGHNRVLDRRHATGRHLETQQTSQQHTPALSQLRVSKLSCHVSSTFESFYLDYLD